MGKLTISMAIFHSYFDITRGSPSSNQPTPSAPVASPDVRSVRRALSEVELGSSAEHLGQPPSLRHEAWTLMYIYIYTYTYNLSWTHTCTHTYQLSIYMLCMYIYTHYINRNKHMSILLLHACSSCSSVCMHENTCTFNISRNASKLLIQWESWIANKTSIFGWFYTLRSSG